ncbi:dodecin family protein [Actinomycetospora sp. CA-101289]|uniref:dodecin family protein n=1 Tax=Actinomycetospora sp. CA-101289 TaxID=3239893 RepID=UPI003D96DF4F
MADSVYRVTQLIGTSTESWEKAAQHAIQTAASSVRDLRIAELEKSDLVIENGQITAYRVRLSLSFKYESES